MRLIQLTDTHLFGDRSGVLKGVNTLASLTQVVGEIGSRRERPAGLLLTGDLSQDESPASYRHLVDALASLKVPGYALMGNHDDTGAMDAGFVGSSIGRIGEITVGTWLVILLDSTLAGQIGGSLSDSELARLERLLQRDPNRPALVVLHHPPVKTGSAWMDAIGLNNPDDLFAVLDRHQQVRGLVWGHVHQAYDGQRNGVRLLSTPATCIQFAPDAAEYALDDIPPGYRWLELLPDGRLESGVVRLSPASG